MRVVTPFLLLLVVVLLAQPERTDDQPLTGALEHGGDHATGTSSGAVPVRSGWAARALARSATDGPTAS